MEKFNKICPDHYPMKCNLSEADKKHLLTPEEYKAFFIFQYLDQDKWLQLTIEKYFSERTWRLFNAGQEGGTGTKFCNVCRYALASDFGIVSLTPLNYNVYQEIGLMQGLEKPLIYLLNPQRKISKMPFDTDDQIYVEHSDEKSLHKGLNNKIPLLLDKLILLTGFETEQRATIESKLSSLSPEAKELLKRMLLEGSFSFLELGDTLDLWVKRTKKWDIDQLEELRRNRFVIIESESGGSRPLFYERLNEPYRKYLEEILF